MIWTRLIAVALAVLVAAPALAQAGDEDSLETQKLMLTGHGPRDAVPWNFTIDGGMRAGEKATIPVPSNWQQHGFGHYQYGVDRARRTRDTGVYQRSIDVPADWRGKTVRIVFDAVMTDALVKVNGTPAGPVHQGGYNRFSYDVTPLIKPGAANDITVEVGESSADFSVDKAERWGDFWTFGGIYRPAWLEARPVEAIAHVAVDAQASGAISAEVTLAGTRSATALVGQVVDREGRAVGAPFTTALPSGGTGLATVRGRIASPLLWSAETPNLYFLDVALMKGDQAVHRVRTRFGFRTFEVRDGDGLYLNGKRILLKGVDRHSFRPATARALDAADSYEDVRIIRSMNMNAARSSHYAPEQAFLEAADELGLYVIDELTGWHFHTSTEKGRILVRELIERDVNHPSIVFWANGNEGGHNRELDPEFARFDPQHRRVLYPYNSTDKPDDESLRPGRAEAIKVFVPHDGVDAKHYPTYAEYARRLSEGTTVLMPTEFLHGLYDGGHGAGLEDYWQAMTASRVGGGGFLWSFSDEGIARSDQGGKLDFAASLAPDGIVGAHNEPEPSYFTVREIWSPVQIAAPVIDAGFDGRLRLTNLHDFTSLSQVGFRWEWLRFRGPSDTQAGATVIAAGTVKGPAVPPGGAGALALSSGQPPAAADALRLTATRGDETLMQWVWPVAKPREPASLPGRSAPRVERAEGTIRLVAGNAAARFDPNTGLLRSIARGGKSVEVGGGPRLVYARPESKEPVWSDAEARPGDIFALAKPGMANVVRVDLGLTNQEAWSGFALDVSPDGKSWKTVFDGMRTWGEAPLYTFPAQQVAAIRLRNVFFNRGEPRVRSVRLGFEDRFNPDELPAAAISTGTGIDPITGKRVVWLEAPGAGGLERARWTLSAGGTLTLDYRYRLEGPMLYHGIGFAAPQGSISAARALLRGPWPVWQNRMRGPQLGVHDIAGPGTLSPDRAGYFAEPHWVTLNMGAASLLIRPSAGTPFLQLGARLNDHGNTSPPFPDTAFGLMQAIPGMGSKVVPVADSGPQSQPAMANGIYDGRVSFDLMPQ